MSFSKNQGITIILSLLVASVTIWGITYTYSPDLIYTEFNPPDTISNYENILRFKLTNYGEKTGTYLLSFSASSDDILFSKNRSPSDEYENNITLYYKLGSGKDVAYNFKFKANNSVKNSNVTVTFTYIDASPWILKKASIYEYDYELNENNNYQLQDEKLYKKTILIINGKIIG